MPTTLRLLRTAPAASRTMPYAKRVLMPNGQAMLPQQYTLYQQNLESVSALLSEIEFDAHTLLFCNQDQQGVYLQVGLIGRENYEHGNLLRPHKLVYGRRWRIDADTPDLEVVQTAFLAIKKAREHEVRELLTIKPSQHTRCSAALSSHQDLAILKSHANTLHSDKVDTASAADYIRSSLEHLRFAQRPVLLRYAELLSNGHYLLDLQIGQAPLARQIEGDFAEFADLEFSLLIKQEQLHTLIFAINDALIQHSDRYVDETFSYAGFKRYSRELDIRKIADLSVMSRPYARDQKGARFMQVFQAANFAVDASRAARLGSGQLAQINRQKIAAYAGLYGHLPADL